MEISRALNVLKVLGFIREISYRYEGQKHVAHTYARISTGFSPFTRGKKQQIKTDLRGSTPPSWCWTKLGPQGWKITTIWPRQYSRTISRMVPMWSTKGKSDQRKGNTWWIYCKGKDHERYRNHFEDLDNDYVKLVTHNQRRWQKTAAYWQTIIS